MPFVFIYLRNCSSHQHEDKALIQAGNSHQVSTISPTINPRGIGRFKTYRVAHPSEQKRRGKIPRFTMDPLVQLAARAELKPN
ncbi:MAG: hypothetical protein WA825_02725 [Steroidobacteraceae bacterium]